MPAVDFSIISLIEHKSDVEYNIHMQIFRYMVYIWEKYERCMEQEKKGCTMLKDFRYLPETEENKWGIDYD